MSNKIAWAGTRSMPLPHESSFSAISRFAWQNVLDAKTIKHLLNGKKISPFGDSFLTPVWLRNCGLKTIANWDLPNTQELQISKIFAESASTFFSTNLRVCPVCYAAGFHSIWHQFILLQYCPLHKCKLIENCTECDVKFGEYRLSRELFDRPYQCYYCGQPLAGAKLELDDMLAQRCEVMSTDAFREFSNWLSCADDETFLLRAVLKGFTFELTDRVSDRRALVIDIANALHPFPPESSWSGCPSQLTLLTWNVRARFANEEYPMKNRRDIARANVNRRMSRNVYTIVVRKLHSWLDTSLPRSALKTGFANFKSNSWLKLNEFDSVAIALIIFRNCFEQSPEYSLPRKIRPTGFRADHRPPVKLYESSDREPRLAYYAIYFAVYAGLYWRIERARARGMLSELRINDLNSLVTKFLLRTDEHVAGGVVFRSVPGLRIPRTLVCSFPEAKKLFTPQNGFRIVTGEFD